jgi:hypothetical protein
MPNGRKIFQMIIKYNNIFYSKALQILPKYGFFGLKPNHLATLLNSPFLPLPHYILIFCHILTSPKNVWLCLKNVFLTANFHLFECFSLFLCNPADGPRRKKPRKCKKVIPSLL